MLDFIAKRYGVLPSYIMKLGDSIDMRCANLGVKYEAYLNNKSAKGNSDHGHSTSQLQEMMERVRNHGSKTSKE